MKTRTLAGRAVHPIGYGALALDEDLPKPITEAVAVLRQVVDSGVTLIDTADVYGLGRNESLIGHALTPVQKARIIIATKAGCTRPGGHDWGEDGRPEHIRAALQCSLQHLDVHQVELYQLHSVDPNVPLVESVRAMRDLQEEGLVRHIGLCNVTLAQVQAAQRVAEIVSVQNRYNLFDRRDERYLLPYLTREGIAYLPYGPLGEGSLATHPKLASISRRTGISPGQLALAWILAKWPTAIPIPGTANLQHLAENLRAAEIELPAGLVEELDGLS